MKKISITTKDAVVRAARILKKEGVIVMPTDTIYGLSAAMSSREGYRRILALKHYATPRPFVYLASSVEMVEAHIAGWGCTSKQHMSDVWPAPLTCILSAGARCPEWIHKTVAFRVPEYEPVRRLIDHVGEPIASTSVNRIGEPPVTVVQEIEKIFGEGVDLIVEDATATDSGRPSTLVDFTPSEPRVIREGLYDWSPR